MDPVGKRFYEFLPNKLRWGHNKSTPHWGNKSVVGKKAAYIELPTNLWKYIILDIDREDAGAIWIDEGFPHPTILLRNPENGHAQYFYELKESVIRELPNGAGWVRPGPIKFYKDVRRGMAKQLCADPGYGESAFNAKNPLGDKWSKHVFFNDRRFDLHELKKCITVPNLPTRVRPRPVDIQSPNGALFVAAQSWAIQHASQYSDCDHLRIALQDYLIEYNFTVLRREHEGQMLSKSDVTAKAKSVAEYVWVNPGMRERTRPLGFAPICQHYSDEEKQVEERVRQSAGARYTHKVRKGKTLESILEAKERLIQRGERLTQVAVAEECGLSRRTVIRYWGQLLEYAE